MELRIENAERVGRLAAQTIASIHLETVEEAENQAQKLAQAGNPGEICLDGSRQQEKVLVHGGHHFCDASHFK